MALTDTFVRQVKWSGSATGDKRSDGGGLYLHVTKAGKYWRMAYRFDGKQKLLAFGVYPAVTLAQARTRRQEARELLAMGQDPRTAEKEAQTAERLNTSDTFEAVAREWHAKQLDSWSPGHGGRTLRQLERDLFPWLGQRPMAEIDPMELLTVLQKIEERGAMETADRALMLARQVYEYWLPTADKTQRNITEGLKKRLTPYRGKNFPAIVEPRRFGELLRAMQAYKGGPVVRTALLLAPLLYQRPGNLRMMEWSELDLDAALWTIPSAKMKRLKSEKENGLPHVVPMPAQAVALLRELQPLTSGGLYVFPGHRDRERPMSDNSVRTALYALGMGKEQSWHGFRASARTMLVDELDLDPLAIEANLAHSVKDANGRSYNRTQYLAKRFSQIQQWADYLDKLRQGADVIAFRAA